MYKIVNMVILFGSLMLCAGDEENNPQNRLEQAVTTLDIQYVEHCLQHFTLDKHTVIPFNLMYTDFCQNPPKKSGFGFVNARDGFTKVIGGTGIAMITTASYMYSCKDTLFCMFDDSNYIPWMGFFTLASYTVRDGVKDLYDPRRSSSYQRILFLLNDTLFKYHDSKNESENVKNSI